MLIYSTKLIDLGCRIRLDEDTAEKLRSCVLLHQLVPLHEKVIRQPEVVDDLAAQ